MRARVGLLKIACSATFGGLVLAFAIGVWAQVAKLTEDSSIKASRNTMTASNLESVRGRLTATNVTLRELIRLAYGVRNYQIRQAPDCIDSERLDNAMKS